MYKIPANTLFLGKNLVYVPECHSTNTLIADLVQKAAAMEGTLVITDHQTAGRGQRGKTWQAAIGLNFTFSFLLQPRFVAVKDQFHLQRVVALGITDYLQTYFTDDLKIKWPNDILIKGKKLCGILIENQLSGAFLSQSVVGIGLNVNQKEFALPAATSMALQGGREFDLVQELEKLLEQLEARYLQLKQHKEQQLIADYLQRMYWRDEIHVFFAHGEEFEGEIKGTNEMGLLQIESREGVRTFDVKEVTYMK